MRTCAFVCFVAVSGCGGADQADRISALEARIEQLEATEEKPDTPRGVENGKNPHVVFRDDAGRERVVVSKGMSLITCKNEDNTSGVQLWAQSQGSVLTLRSPRGTLTLHNDDLGVYLEFVGAGPDREYVRQDISQRNQAPPPVSEVQEHIIAKSLTLIGHKGKSRVHFDGNVLRVGGLVAQNIYTSNAAMDLEDPQPHDTAGIFMTGSEGGATLMLVDDDNGQVGVGLETRPGISRISINEPRGHRNLILRTGTDSGVVVSQGIDELNSFDVQLSPIENPEN